MRHAIRYEGGYERNLSTLRPGAVDFEGDDGARHAMAAWPAEMDGVRFGIMERHGKRFVAVRVQYGTADLILTHDVPLDAARHLGGRHMSPGAFVLADTYAGALLGDAIDANPEQRAPLVAVRDEIRRALGTHKS